MSNPIIRSIILTLQTAVVLVGLIGFYAEPGSVVTGPGTADPSLAMLLAEVDTDSLMQTVHVLASEKTRRFTSKGATAAVEYITKRLTAAGYSVEHQYVNVASKGRSIVVTNVLCDLGVEGKSSLLLCAHYDSRGEILADFAPGADDNASGVAVLLETARVLAKLNARTNVRLAFFGGEEDAFIGSQGYVDDLSVDLPAFIINVDMVGYDEYGAMDMVVFSNRESLPIVDVLESAAARHTRIQLSTRIETTGNSDHITFWKRGVPAVSIWEGYDHNPHYHTARDLPENLSPAFMTEVARLIAAVAFKMGTPDGASIGARFTARTPVAASPIVGE